MSLFASPLFLRRVLWADAASCLGCGALQLVALDGLPRVLGLPQPLLAATGAFLVAYAAVVAWIASRRTVPRMLVALCAAGNLGWAAACVAAIAWWQPPAAGVAWIALQAACVVVLAELQWMALRATRTHRQPLQA